MYFHPKMAWPPATYDVISRNHSNWPSLNLSQNVRKGWTNSYWKRQVLMFYPLGKTQKNLCGGSIHRHPPLVRPWVKPCRAGLETGRVKYRLGGLDFVLSFLFPLFCVLCGVIFNSVFKSIFSINSAAGFRNTKHKHGSTVRVKIYIKLRAVVHKWDFDLSAEI